jgi:DNA repair exonuclease SbcCD ATPase subunit
VAIALAVLVLVTRERVARLKEAVHTAGTESESLKAEATQLTRALTNAEHEAADVKGLVEERRLAEKEAAQRRQRASENRRDPVAVMQNSPELQLRALAVARDRTAVEYAPLFRRLKLSPEQIQRFLDARMRYVEMATDLAAIQQDPATIAGLRQQYERDFESAVHNDLGDAVFADYRQYERSQPLRTAVLQAIAEGSLTGSDMTPDQAEQMVALLAQANQNYCQGRTAALSMEDWNSVLANPGSFSRADIHAVQTAVERIRTENRLMGGLQRARKPGG